MTKSTSEIKREESEKALREKKLVAEIVADFENRREQRRSVENGWILNMNFFSGNQYCDVSPFGGVEQEDMRFYWQSRRVFNHIAPTVESRLAKLETVRPTLRVRAFSDEDSDLKAAKLATGVLKYVQERIDLSQIVSRATVWSEVCGSAFYKVVWDEQGGRQVAVDEQGAPIFEGEVQVSVVSPFEIFPDKLHAENWDDVGSLIHAKVVSAGYVFEKFGVALKGEELSQVAAFSYSQPTAGKLPFMNGGVQYATENDAVILIERYTRPCAAFPKGRVEIVAGDRLLFEGDLPYQNGERGERDFPFVKQDCMRLPGAFFGASIVDRLIPVQRAYNAVRNRKHEFLNRLSMGVLTVEDGAVDVDELAEEGLLPGKVLVYRQGGKAPEMLDCGKMPTEFAAEEEWLEKEFALISGVSDLSQNSTPARVTSATGLQLFLEQDEARLSATIYNVERAMKAVARQTLRLYRQCAGNARLMTLTGENKKTQVYYFNASELAVSDVQFEAADVNSPEEKRETLLKLYQAGILTDGDGKLTVENKNRILEAFGFGGFENARDISSLHIGKAAEENLDLKTQAVEVDEFDEHLLHINEHTRFLLSSEYKQMKDKAQVKARVLAHIALHKKMEKQNKGE